MFGANPKSALMAAPVRPRARSSNTCPNKTSVTITAAASKYTPTSPASLRNELGKISGNSVAITL